MDITEVENRRVRAVIDAWFAEEELPDMGETPCPGAATKKRLELASNGCASITDC
jgi:hypothetical protein